MRGKTRERAREFLAARENQRKEEEGEKGCWFFFSVFRAIVCREK
jgi:hypothetical protein